MDFVELIKSVFLGIIQGVTEWLPISSTGHMIIFNTFFPLDAEKYIGGSGFVDLFLVIVQLGSIFAVLFLFSKKLNPFSSVKSYSEKVSAINIWKKVAVGSVPVFFVGCLLKDFIHRYCYNGFVVAFMLILYGVFFIVIENSNSKLQRIDTIDKITYAKVLSIGLFQSFALIPGTSRSGATILGALLVGCTRSVSTEFSFFLAVPAMFGASFLSLRSYFKENGVCFSVNGFFVLLVGFVVAFFVSVIVIKKLVRYIKSHSFKSFAYYRIVVGIILVLFLFYSIYIGRYIHIH